MVTTHVPKPDPSAIGAKVSELVESGHELYATTVTGTPAGRVRRPTLFIIAVVGVVLAIVNVPFAGVVALIAILLLMLSDAVVEL